MHCQLKLRIGTIPVILAAMSSSQQSDILFSAFNARYAHTSFGARYILANMGELKERAELLEFDLQVQPRIAVEKMLRHHPKIVCIGCYIWNIDLATKVAALLKAICPEIKLILGGPEISYETEKQEIFQYADYVICGEGEVEVRKLCRSLLAVPTSRRAACDTEADVPQAARLPEKFAVPPAARRPGSPGFHPFEQVHQSQRKNLPHWVQGGCTYFVTFRLADSIPQSRIKEYEELRRKWEEHHHPPYSEKERERFNELFSEQLNEWLDAGAGSCGLRKPELAAHVAETLQRFDGDRYELDEWVVMPNHVHVLVKPLPGHGLSTILHTWKSYSAHAINQELKRDGPLWQKESHDHIVRDLDEFVRIQNYISRNPEKAGISVAFSGSRRAACDTGAAEPAAIQNVPQAARLPARIIRAEMVDVEQIELPYDLYSDEDIKHRAIYVEASRGCPFRCEYCMSSLDPCVRYFPEEKLFSAFGKLLDRGALHFKFVDRTFNIDITFALKVLAFFKERYVPGMMLHFEVIPSHLPDELMDAVKDCPSGMLQFEVGIQTFNEAVAHRIQRPLNIAKIEANMRRLREETGVHIHSDLIAGLPGEDLISFEAGFNQLLALNPQEIQLGILKRLRGAPIDRHSRDWNMVYSPHAPYEILSTSLIPFEDMQRVQRFARYWNLVVNNGQFIRTAPMLWAGSRRAACDTQSVPLAAGLHENPIVPQAARLPTEPSAFSAFMQFSDWLYAKTNTTGNLHMVRLAKLLMEFQTLELGLDEKAVAETLWSDYQRGNRPDVPGFLKKFGFEKISEPSAGSRRAACDTPTVPQASRLPRQNRQNRHLQD